MTDYLTKAFCGAMIETYLRWARGDRFRGSEDGNL